MTRRNLAGRGYKVRLAEATEEIERLRKLVDSTALTEYDYLRDLAADVAQVARLRGELAELRKETAGLAKAAGLREQLRLAVDELDRTRQIVDLAGIARHMKVERFTPQQWKQRGHLPPVDFPEINEPLWYASTIRREFADRTQRVWYDNPDEELSPAA
jgi:hypothetical protein